jgi:hypothetical protein
VISYEEETTEFIGFIKNSNQFSTNLVPVGKGEFVVYKNA